MLVHSRESTWQYLVKKKIFFFSRNIQEILNWITIFPTINSEESNLNKIEYDMITKQRISAKSKAEFTVTHCNGDIREKIAIKSRYIARVAGGFVGTIGLSLSIVLEGSRHHRHYSYVPVPQLRSLSIPWLLDGGGGGGSGGAGATGGWRSFPSKHKHGLTCMRDATPWYAFDTHVGYPPRGKRLLHGAINVWLHLIQCFSLQFLSLSISLSFLSLSLKSVYVTYCLPLSIRMSLKYVLSAVSHFRIYIVLKSSGFYNIQRNNVLNGDLYVGGYIATYS